MYRTFAALTFLSFCAGCTVMTPRPQAEQFAENGMQVFPITSNSWFGDGRLLLKAGPYAVENAKSEWGSAEINEPETHFRLIDDRWVDLVLGLKKRAPAFFQEQTKEDGFAMRVATPSGQWNVKCKLDVKLALIRWYENDPTTIGSKAAITDCALRDAAGTPYQLYLSYDHAGFREAEFVSESAAYPVVARYTTQMQSSDGQQRYETEQPYATEYQLQEHGETVLRVGLKDRGRALALSTALAAEQQERLAVAALVLSSVDILWRSHLKRDTLIKV